MFYLAPAVKCLLRCLVLTLLVSAPGGSVSAQENGNLHPTVIANVGNVSDGARDGLSGPVRRVRTEVVELSLKDGKLVEGPRVLLETAVYNRQGTKIDQSVYAVSSSPLIGKEVYKYDARGNIVEMTVRDDAGSVVSREVYAYEFDALGNWTKMSTSVAVVENNEIVYEPTEITYRAIAYYLTDAVAKVIPAGPGDVSGRIAPARPTQVNKALEIEDLDQATKLAAAGDVGSAAAAAGVASSPLVNPSANGEPPPPMIHAPKSAGALSEPRPEKMAAGGSSAQTEEQVAEQHAVGQAPKPPVKPVSGGVLNGRAIDLPMPIYKESARRSGDEGTVSVKVLIDVTGKVIWADAVSGPFALRGAAVEAARRARFSPTLLSGQPIRLTGVINYQFTLRK